MRDEIDEARQQVRKSERNVEAQRWRVNALKGAEPARWMAEQLLAASEETLRRDREHLDGLLDPERREHTEQRHGYHDAAGEHEHPIGRGILVQ